MFTLALLTFLLPSASLAVNHIVTVGQNGLTYVPSSTTAAIGDTVQFNYYPMNHTVTQSTFKNPCAPLVNGTVKGFSSGFVPSAPGAQQIPSYSLTVTSLSPIWFYCAQGQHCQAGMVGAINAPQSGNTFEAFAANAKSATKVTAPVALAPSGVGASQLGSISSVPVASAVSTAGAVASASVSGSPALTAGGNPPPTAYSTAASPYGSGTYGTPVVPAGPISSLGGTTATALVKSAGHIVKASVTLLLAGLLVVVVV